MFLNVVAIGNTISTVTGELGFVKALRLVSSLEDASKGLVICHYEY
ncbi:hypothetical protein Hanom_Chr01g00042941 [Helianthus anomalus]